jgi:murein DD-endopeptidase MepM/ murein hydrolase activator NlpD
MSLGGVWQLDEATLGRWGAAGTWRMPVGDPTELGRGASPEEPPFQLNRGLERTRGRITHQGADLADGREGDTVRAAASGLVVLAFDGSGGSGYGGHVVLAHRIEDDGLAYTVYAHLARGTVGVKAGDVVCAGDPLARVGRTGRASTPHLHFEVRLPEDPAQRWESAPVVDPLAFVESRLADPPRPHETASRYVEWARHESLLPAGGDPEAPLTRASWWRMMALAARPEGAKVDPVPAEVRDGLIEAGLLPEEEGNAPPGERLSWTELARDVKRLRGGPVATPHGPLEAADHEAECESRFGERRPSAHTGSLKRLSGDPSGTDACVLLADLSGPRTEVNLRPVSRSARVPKPVHRHSHPGQKKRSRSRR